MTIGIRTLAVLAWLLFSGEAQAWQARDAITGTLIEILWPSRPSDVAAGGNHEIQYRIAGEPEVRLGEVTTWLSKCYGRHCPTRQTRTFELNTFSARGLMYCFPLDTP
jgi:hypothetical protein